MSKALFTLVFKANVASSAYLRQRLRPDVCERIGINPLQKVIFALRQLAHGLPSDLADDFFDLSESTAPPCLTEFCKAITKCFSLQYLRSPTAEDLVQIGRSFARVSFPGCPGCLHGAGWT